MSSQIIKINFTQISFVLHFTMASILQKIKAYLHSKAILTASSSLIGVSRNLKKTNSSSSSLPVKPEPSSSTTQTDTSRKFQKSSSSSSSRLVKPKPSTDTSEIQQEPVLSTTSEIEELGEEKSDEPSDSSTSILQNFRFLHPAPVMFKFGPSFVRVWSVERAAAHIRYLNYLAKANALLLVALSVGLIASIPASSLITSVTTDDPDEKGCVAPPSIPRTIFRRVVLAIVSFFMSSLIGYLVSIHATYQNADKVLVLPSATPEALPESDEIQSGPAIVGELQAYSIIGGVLISLGGMISGVIFMMGVIINYVTLRLGTCHNDAQLKNAVRAGMGSALLVFVVGSVWSCFKFGGYWKLVPANPTTPTAIDLETGAKESTRA